MAWVACKKLYTPNAVSANLNYLVVEGTINTGGTDTTFIKLTRTNNINNLNVFKGELKASVKVESDNNSTYTLTEKGAGIYYLPPTSLGYTQKYRIHIKTGDGHEYASEYVIPKKAPPIDTITYTAGAHTGVQLFASSHDPSNNTRYYRWDFTETWEYHSAYESLYIYNGTAVAARDMVHDDVYTCWRSQNSNSITLGSTAKLSKDIMADAPITSIEAHSPKITVMYSMLLRQYAMSEDEYKYWDNIRKNNETLGSIFDAQPSDSKGNIKSLTNGNEVVIGFIGAGNFTAKRIFIARAQLPILVTPLDNCVLDTVLFKNENTFFGGNPPQQIPVGTYSAGLVIAGHTGASPDCVDCRIKGGVTRKPDFWP